MIEQEKKFPRLLSLDVFRGITIALMIVVNCPGNDSTYNWLEHSAWDGCTLADLVFPFFVFIVGVASVFSLSKSRAQGGSLQQLLPKIIKRTILIFLIGLFLNAFPYHFDFATIRVFGVLQRIAICYFFSAFLFLTTQPRTQLIVMFILVLGYWLLMAFWPVPGYGANNLTPQANLAAYVDRLLFSSAHLYGKVYDPEGFLSTVPAITTVLLGNLTGIGLLTTASQQKKLVGMSMAGISALLIGWLWGLWFPINKALWTSSYVLWTGGLALLVLAFCYWTIDIRGWKRWCKPLEIFGVNAMAAYILHIFFLKIQLMITLPNRDGFPGNLRSYITEHLFGWASPPDASLLYALSYTFFWLVILTILYRKKIYIRI